MKVLVIGATGGTGRELVTQARSMGLEVSALVHNANDYSEAGVRVIEGDVLDVGKVREAVSGQDAVLDALGGQTPWKETGLEPEAARNVVDAMEQLGVRRLIVVSAMGVGESEDSAGFLYGKLLVPTYLRGAMKDKTNMESQIEAGGLEWVVVRPAALTDGDATGNVKVFTPGMEEKAHKISRKDVATFMLQQLTSDTYLHQKVTIATE